LNITKEAGLLSRAIGFALALSLLSPLPAGARIARLDILKTEPFAGGVAFGDAGPYEQITARATGEVDPKAPQNAIIQDIALAPRNANDMVEYSTDVVIVRPVHPEQGAHALLLDVLNRGDQKVFNAFNLGLPGDGFLQRRGISVVLAGWQPGPLGPGRLTITVPVARHPDGSSITGQVRMEYDPARNSPSLPIDTRGSSSYEPASPDTSRATLTMRVHEGDPRVAIPPDQWAFADCTKTPFPGVPSARNICPKNGFDTNHIYELVYEAKDPLVDGLAFAAVRDLIAFLHHAQSGNPLAGDIKTTLLFGHSQAGRMARSFLELGFNRDEDGRIVFDGMNPHVAPTRMNLNTRFAQPGRDSGLEHVEHAYIGTEPPYAWSAQPDPLTGHDESLLDRCQATKTCPKIFQTVTDTEYWQRGMSLATGSMDGKTDLKIPGNVRIYDFGDASHIDEAVDATATRVCKFADNPNAQNYEMRALLVSLLDWVAGGKAPPPSRYPTYRAGMLVSPDPKAIGFPKIPGVNFAGLYNARTLYDRGPQFNSRDESGIALEPPKPLRQLPVRVPKVDRDGNSLGGLPTVTHAVPLGTYMGWNLRAADFGEDDLCDNTGSFIPFAKTRAEREKTGDPRLSLEERYKTHDGYVAAVAKAAKKLVAARLLLPEDADRSIAAAKASDVLN
jgi:hypothetical protein